ncbi:MAG: tRNA uridine-5-carboxymethylaminomethyl(34) synthesis GTPase MnmE [Phascolarctobacterium sp.]|nr:tRNA uridine-5-carboxymethylaminomethyl(34) synthesis GTPase MnmE [Phascolarctobacterium sp.]
MEDTISAVASALGEGAVGIIRISGTKALEIGEKLFRAASGKALASYPTHTLVYGHVYDYDNSLVDEVLTVYMKGPRSYTAEDVVEIQCHGGIQSLKKILKLTYEAGARPAEAGEFTKRAFLNGRIDLTQAEAVMDIIQSRSELGLKVAVQQQQGQLAKALRAVRKELVDVIVNLEAVIDYPEEDIEDVTYGQVEKNINVSLKAMDNLLNNAQTGKILREGLKTAIVGRPNVGKSSLLNALLKEERAIVSEYAGTTRDVIEEQLLVDGVPLVLADTAGIRDTEDFVERIGVERSRKLLEQAELVICVLDASKSLEMEDMAILDMSMAKDFVIILNKSDLAQKVILQELKDKYGPERVLALSAKTGAGVEDFVSWLKNYVFGQDKTLGNGIYIQNARQENLLRQAKTSLEDALEAVENTLPYDCIVIDVRNAIDLLGEITGDTVKDEIINEIFARFCVGK